MLLFSNFLDMEDSKFENSCTKWKHTKQFILKIHEVVEQFQKSKMNKMEGYPIFVDNFTSSSDFYNVGDDSSSDEGANSSGDEIDDDLNRRADEGSESDSFEKEMEMELNKEFSKYSQQLFDDKKQNAEKPLHESKEEMKDEAKQDEAMEAEKAKQDEKQDETYDEIYFSSGSEDDEDNVGGVSSKSKERRTVKTDDELLYDPNMDDEDEKWVKQLRQEHHQEPKCEVSTDDKNTNTRQKAAASGKNFTSDAILACPACLTTLCIDCQRHDTYKQQFRAMFVMNCKVISDETLRYEAKKQKKKSKKNKELPDNVTLEQSELYNPVQCTSCNTEVAVFDKDEVYHFFNVVESLP